MKIKAWLLGPSGDLAILNRLAPVGTVIAVLLFAYELAALTWTAVPVPPSVAPGSRSGTEMPARQDKQAYRQLAALHLFGEEAKTGTQQSQPINAPETNLNLSLRGVLYDTDPNGARAIIGNANGNERDYRVGDPVPGGASLDRIYPERVILLRNGRYETLKLPEKPLASVPAPTIPASSERGAIGNQTAMLQRYRRQMISRPQLAGRYIQAVPVQRNGHFLGFRVRPGVDKGLFQAAGLHDGDIVKSVNGLALDSEASGFKALNVLARSRNVVLRIERNGREQTLHLRFKE